MEEKNQNRNQNPEQQQTPHKRRVRYKGTHPRRFEEKYKELNPEKYASTISFQTVQGLYAIGSGGFFGKGLGNGVQKTVIPEVQNDMILSAICEELGVFGAIIILVLFGLLIYRLLFIAQNAPDLYGALIMTGIMSHIAIQVILNVMVVTNMMPNTGITLPFISYGGTSLAFLMVEMGFVLSVSRQMLPYEAPTKEELQMQR